MAIKIQVRRGTASEWTSANPILLAGEIGLEIDTLKIKAGNGSAAWTSLSYATVSPSELTSALSAKVDKNVSIDAKISSYTLQLSDSGKLIEMNVATANNLTVPLNSSVAFPIGTKIDILQTGAGQTTILPEYGVTINAVSGLKLSEQWAAATLVKRDTNTWVLIGNLVE